ncbi:FMRFamide receptor-like [Watersipora subatra]|uniref:FMRFamide receptor-like n=1 Tax=Watersipora subatra TaxID=2589382 RepID=UPI00355B3FBA
MSGQMEASNSTTDQVLLGNISMQPYAVQLTAFVCYQVLGIPISLFGIIGNIVCIFVWTRKRMQWGVCSTSDYLVALSCSDLVYLLVINIGVLMPNWLVPIQNHFHYIFPRLDSLHKMHDIAKLITDVSANIGVFAMMAFTIERYIAITYPMKRLAFCTPKKARYILLTGTLVVVLLHIPNTLAEIPSMTNKHYSESIVFHVVYNWGVMVLLFVVAPLFVLSIFNSLLIRSVFIAVKERRAMAPFRRFRTHQQERRSCAILTMTIIVVVMVFFLCHSPAAVALIIFTYNGNSLNSNNSKHDSSWDIIFTIVNLLIILSASLNFLIYSVLCGTFRKTVRSLMWGSCSQISIISRGNMSSNPWKMTTTSADESLYKKTQRLHVVKRSMLVLPKLPAEANV